MFFHLLSFKADLSYKNESYVHEVDLMPWALNPAKLLGDAETK